MFQSPHSHLLRSRRKEITPKTTKNHKHNRIYFRWETGFELFPMPQPQREESTKKEEPKRDLNREQQPERFLLLANCLWLPKSGAQV